MVQCSSHPLSDRISTLVQQQRLFFNTGKPKEVAFRVQQLRHLHRAITSRENEILTALKADLGKPEFEAFFEFRVLKEIESALKQLHSWTKPNRVGISTLQFPATAWIQPEPLGVVLIISPWNYPLDLTLSPLVGAIAAGNCVLLKPSEVTSHTSRVMAELIESTFSPDYVTVLEGGLEVGQAVLEETFDHIFFTGGTAVGKLIMAAAAKHLTPVTLELGGKSPCIVDQDVDIACTARRIVWGKFINAGQTCIAPDYLLVHQQIKSALIEAMGAAIQQFYGQDPSTSKDYARIASPRHFNRLVNFLQDGQIRVGGQINATDCYIAPTILDAVSLDAPIMQEEIFGPILPVLAYNTLSEAIALINARPKPLALYCFSRDRRMQEQVLRETSSGGVCINDTLMQFGVPALPFGGVGASGMGRYHGKYSFDTFSHYKSILRRPFWLDLKLRYAPYEGKLSLLKKLQ